MVETERYDETEAKPSAEHPRAASVDLQTFDVVDGKAERAGRGDGDEADERLRKQVAALCVLGHHDRTGATTRD